VRTGAATDKGQAWSERLAQSTLQENPPAPGTKRLARRPWGSGVPGSLTIYGKVAIKFNIINIIGRCILAGRCGPHALVRRAQPTARSALYLL